MSKLGYFKSMLLPDSSDWAARNIASDGAVEICRADLVEMLEATLNGDLTPEELRDWANLVLFNDAFEFDGEVIRDALDRIEESDEPGAELSTDELRTLLNSLR